MSITYGNIMAALRGYLYPSNTVLEGVQYDYRVQMEITPASYANVYVKVRDGSAPYTYAWQLYSTGNGSHWDIFYFNTNYGGEIAMWQPLSYNAKTLPNIIYNYAVYVAGFTPSTTDRSNIDLASFTAVDAWCIGNNFYFSPIFFQESSLKIIKDMCEQCAMVFIYTNGEQKLACGYFEHSPTAPDHVLDEGEFTVKAYGEIRDRSTPETVKRGWIARHCAPGNPAFGATTDTTASIDGEKLLHEYEAKFAENPYFIDFGDYVQLEIEVGPKAFTFDLDEVVQINYAPFGLSLDPDYPDYFRIHKIVYDLAKKTARVTLIKNKSWNSSI